MKPILFNTDMVRAILAGRKTVTRRVVRPQPPDNDPHNVCFDYIENGTAKFGLRNRPPHFVKSPYQPGDLLYVRETWCPYDRDHIIDGIKYAYKANTTPESDGVRQEYGYKWRPSIHMPKEAARIFLRVTGVRTEQLRDMTEGSARAEGFTGRAQAIKAILTMYPNCTEDSWFWVNEFERISREDARNDSGKN